MMNALKTLLNSNVHFSTVIDVGSADGHFFLHAASQGLLPGAVPLHIDANAVYEGSLQAIKNTLGGDFRICAVTDHEGEIEMTTSTHPYWSSLRPSDDPYWSRINHLSESKMKVKATSLDTLVRETAVKPPFLLKLDVQGAEVEALRGAAQVLKDTQVVICEADIKDFQDINQSLVERNFVLYDMAQLVRLLDGKLGWFYPIYLHRDLGSVLPKAFWDAEHNQTVIGNQIKRRDEILRALPELIRRAKAQQ